jgi:hypothetical protein
MKRPGTPLIPTMRIMHDVPKIIPNGTIVERVCFIDWNFMVVGGRMLVRGVEMKNNIEDK